MKVKVITLLLGTLLGGCMLNAMPTAEDVARKERLASTHGDRYEFTIEDVYLRAESKSGPPSREDAAEFVRLYWIANGSRREDSHVNYLNMYEEGGRFAFQAYWDPSANDVGFSTTEHH